MSEKETKLCFLLRHYPADIKKTNLLFLPSPQDFISKITSLPALKDSNFCQLKIIIIICDSPVYLSDVAKRILSHPSW